MYGGVFAGVLGAIVLPTSEPTVPAFDVLATDPWPAADPPLAAVLLYNPLTKPLNVTVRTAALKDLTGGHGAVAVVDTASPSRQSWGKATPTAVDGGKALYVSGTVPPDFAVVLEFREQ